jgi:peptide/nickel transport system substrate-binding protein
MASRRAWLILAAIVAVLSVACGALEQAAAPDGDPGERGDRTVADSPYLGVTSSDDRPEPGGRLSYGLPADTNSFNPGIAQWGGYSYQVVRALFDPLLAYDADGNVRNYLYEKVEHNADYTEWWRTLRPGVRFHNGRVLTAQDIVRAQNLYMKSEVLGSTYAAIGLERYDAIGDRVLHSKTRKPWPMMRQQSTGQFSYVVDPEWMESNRDVLRPVGTGPFKIESWDVGKGMKLVRNPDYWRTDRWGTRLPYLDGIDFTVVPDDQQRVGMVQDGKLDVSMQILSSPAVRSARDLCRDGRFQCFSDQKNGTPENLVILNGSKAPLNSVEARRALAMAVDREEFAQKLSLGLAEPADSPFSPASPWYSPTDYPTFDPEGAAEMVQKVKVRNRGLFRFSMLVSATPEAGRMSQYLQEAWRKVGIEVDLQVIDTADKLRRHVMGDFQASLTQLFDGDHPTGITAFVDSPVVEEGKMSVAFSRLGDPEIHRLVEEMAQNDPENFTALRTANARLMARVNRLVPFVWLVHEPRTFVARPNVVNITRSVLPDGEIAADFHLGSHALGQVWIRRS